MSSSLRPTIGLFIIAVAALVIAVGVTGKSRAAETASAEGEQSDMVRVRVIGPDGELSGPVEMPRVELTEAEWKQRLTPEQFAVIRSKGTERPFCGTLLDNKQEGIYFCVACKLPLFASNSKFDSGTGWPSFFQPVAKENILEDRDLSHGMVRVEIMCQRCEGHLGHVFEDGPRPTGLRYCLNSESLTFVAQADLKSAAEEIPVAKTETKAAPKVGDKLPAPEKDTALADAPGTAKAIFAGGCFWCTEAVFEELDGVSKVVSGYSGGDADTANYDAVCTGKTGHAEAIEITYDPSKVTYGQLLRIFFATHNPTEKDKQGPDVGTQYRSAVFFADEEQKAVASAYIKQLNGVKAFPKSIETTLEPLEAFYEAEDYHQDFAKSNPDHPYIRAWSDPKVEKLKSKFPEHLRTP